MTPTTENLASDASIKQGSFDYESLFPFVKKPSRYIGSEWNSITKPEFFRKNAVGICLCFPDLYETGFSNTGIEILYQIVNQRDDAFAERAYVPDTDLACLLRQHKFPFFSLESRTPLVKFDLVGFTLPYELCYTNILEILDLSGIPFRSTLRNERHPILIAGGPCAVNPEPVADFFDAIVIGDGEETIGEIIDAVKNYKQFRKTKKELLLNLSKISGVYVPSLYDVFYHTDGTNAKISPKFGDVPEKVSYRQADLEKPMSNGFSFPVAPTVPFVQTVHDRLNVEIQRGCRWRCRFCQAGFSYRPYRERSKENLVRIIEEGLKNTGYDAVTLSGLSASDHTEIVSLAQTLSEKLSPKRISIGLPSMRADRFTLALAELLNKVRRQSITFALEAGTERLRRVIRKELQETEIRETLKTAYQHGWKNIKLYFMYGLPTETQADLEGIVQLIRDIKKENPGLSFTLTLSPFVPKPHTPCQWERQERLEVLREKLNFLRKNLPVQIRAHGLEQVIVEGIISRGDRRCSELIETVWKMGGKFDEWSERFRFDFWEKAFEMTQLFPEIFCHRLRDEKEIFPWDHLQGGPEKKVLWNDYQLALRQAKESVPISSAKTGDTVLTKSSAFPSGTEPSGRTVSGIAIPRSFKFAAEKSVQRLRFRMSRKGSIRFLSHLEQIEMVRRALRRAGFPLVYTAGFHPQIRCSFGPAISVGYESECEYFEVDFSKRIELEQAEKLLSSELPRGFSVLKVSRIPLFFPSLESMLNRVSYSVTIPQHLLENKKIESLDDFLKREDLFLEKRKKGDSIISKRIPLKPLIVQMEWAKDNSMNLTLGFGPGKNVKPERIVGLFIGLSEDESRALLVNRRAFYIYKQDDTFVEP